VHNRIGFFLIDTRSAAKDRGSSVNDQTSMQKLIDKKEQQDV
jgi:hypothetical protein